MIVSFAVPDTAAVYPFAVMSPATPEATAVTDGDAPFVKVPLKMFVIVAPVDVLTEIAVIVADPAPAAIT